MRLHLCEDTSKCWPAPLDWRSTDCVTACARDRDGIAGRAPLRSPKQLSARFTVRDPIGRPPDHSSKCASCFHGQFANSGGLRRWPFSKATTTRKPGSVGLLEFPPVRCLCEPRSSTLQRRSVSLRGRRHPTPLLCSTQSTEVSQHARNHGYSLAPAVVCSIMYTHIDVSFTL
jgi:hypothetical protein